MATSTQSAIAQTSRLLSIPPELRNTIYEFAFFASFPDINDPTPSKKGDYSKSFALTATCRQIRAEAHGLLANCLTTHKEACWKEAMALDKANKEAIEEGLMTWKHAFDIQSEALAKYFAANHALFCVDDGSELRNYGAAGVVTEGLKKIEREA